MQVCGILRCNGEGLVLCILIAEVHPHLLLSGDLVLSR